MNGKLKVLVEVSAFEATDIQQIKDYGLLGSMNRLLQLLGWGFSGCNKPCRTCGGVRLWRDDIGAVCISCDSPHRDDLDRVARSAMEEVRKKIEASHLVENPKGRSVDVDVKYDSGETYTQQWTSNDYFCPKCGSHTVWERTDFPYLGGHDMICESCRASFHVRADSAADIPNPHIPEIILAIQAKRQQ